jgi:SAM-dependent methyltransferase
MREIADWAGGDVVDIGCGTGYHLPFFAATARSVLGVEPHPPLASLARERISGMSGCSVREDGAAAIGMPDGSFDVAHARWAYFFGPGCEPGLAELDRVVRRGGAAFVIDNDPTRSTFGAWFRRGYPDVDPTAVERFWSTRGWTRTPVDMGWSFSSRADLESVVRIELPTRVAEEVLAGHEGTDVDYAVNVWWKRF